MSNWYLSFDSDSAILDRLADWSVFLSAPYPAVKTNYVETMSSVVPMRDNTDNAGTSIYSSRQLTLVLVKKDVAGSFGEESKFINTYYGKRVRVIEAESGRFYVGRIDSVNRVTAGANQNSLKLVCNITAEPAFYDAEYTVVDTDAINKTTSGDNKAVDNANIVRSTFDNVSRTSSAKLEFTMDATTAQGGVTTGGIVIRVPAGKQIRIRSVSVTNLTYDLYEYDNTNQIIGERIGKPSVITNETSGYLYYVFYVKISDATNQAKIGFKIDTLSPVAIENDGLPVIAQYASNIVGDDGAFSGLALVINNHSISPKREDMEYSTQTPTNYNNHPIMVLKSGTNYVSAYPTVYTSAESAEGKLLVRYRRGVLV